MMNWKKCLRTIQIKTKQNSALWLATYPLILLGRLVSPKASSISKVHFFLWKSEVACSIYILPSLDCH